MRDINEGFPPDSTPYTEYYDYTSDSDLEDESSGSEEDEENPCEDRDTKEPSKGDELKPQRGPLDSIKRVPATKPPEDPPRPPRDLGGIEDDHRLAHIDVLPNISH